MEATVSLGPPIGLIISAYTVTPAGLSLGPQQPPYTPRRAQVTIRCNLAKRVRRLLIGPIELHNPIRS